jgi:hypothetical protein
MSQTTQRRALKFDTLDEVIRDVEMLHSKGYNRLGNWDLAQISLHLADWLRYPVEGYPKMPLFLRPIMWTMKVTMGKGMLRKILKSGKMSEKGQTMPQTVHASGEDPTQAMEKLKTAIESWKKHSGEYHPSPLFGKWDRETATKLQLIHCAHHLSFLVPKSN